MKIAVYIGIGETGQPLDSRVEGLLAELRNAECEVVMTGEDGAGLAGCDFLLSVGGDGKNKKERLCLLMLAKWAIW